MVLDPNERESVVAFLRDHGRGVVATVSPEGVPEAALVGLVALDDGSILFNALASSRKVANLGARPVIAIVVGTDGDVTLQIEGPASIAGPDRRAALGEEFLRHAPGSRVHEEGFALVVVTPEWVRVYDASAAPSVSAEARWDAGIPPVA
ncbi:pyridoxamine 5'-phosphate oxidase family protein [Microbacterium sp. NEAU-LLC]|uniref:Pyridoxamine 5'-phosphate oxidase family protein n=1 Tax=Microbacterium helvum TaxID=2773713 RepID=A0ABR8NM69_9MICO|nr:pyridoxamine 5'-phosphate oxidase family protein [Microbacterium helvum]MBD3941008.1 pyridoxamine 5'-phosphate oxidase family protein [Microbacterium helvum]